MSLYELHMFRVIEDSTDPAELIRIQHEHPEHSVALRAAARLRELNQQDAGNRLASSNIYR